MWNDTKCKYSSNAESRRADSGLGVDGVPIGHRKNTQRGKAFIAHMLRLYVEYMH